ncbi:MAG TPA: MFS transporter [Microbacterium sp.]|nr:MFS transporter [Microbacterium sp.]
MQIIIFGMRPALSYAALALGSSPASLGALSAFYALPALLLALPAGRVTDVIGERRGMVIGSVAVAAAAALAVLTGGSLPLLMAASVLLGCGQMFTVLGEQSYVGSVSAAHRSDAAFGVYGFAVSLGQTIGPLMLILPGGTAALPPVTLVFGVALGCAVLMLVVSLLIRSPDRTAMPARDGMLRAARGVLATRGLPPALIAGSLVLASVDIFIAYAPLIGRDRGFSAVVISVMLVARSGFSMVSRLFLGRLTRGLGRRRLLVGSILLSAVMLAGFVFELPGPALVVLAAGYGFVVGICQPITMSWISLIAPPGTRGLAMSMRLAANRLGQTLLPVSVGALAAVAGAAGVLGASSIMLVVAALSGAGLPDDPARPSADEPPVA